MQANDRETGRRAAHVITRQPMQCRATNLMTLPTQHRTSGAHVQQTARDDSPSRRAGQERKVSTSMRTA
eukprot:2000735-Alexandrium_andersonii.AAC.1